jgi:hypothetical protein
MGCDVIALGEFGWFEEGLCEIRDEGFEDSWIEVRNSMCAGESQGD